MSAAGRGVAWTEERSDEGRLFRAARRSPWAGMVARRTEAPRGVSWVIR